MPDLDYFLIGATAAKIACFTGTALFLVVISVYFERRLCAVMQDRVGPNRTGIPLSILGFKKDLPFFGLIQPMADGAKLFLKEDFTPAHVRKFFFWIAPALVLAPPLITLCVIPFGSEICIPGCEPVKLVIANLNVGPLFVFAISSLTVYGITIAGWASNSKYSFLGGVRSTAQMISYEISLGLSIIPILMIMGNLNLNDIVAEQAKNGWLLAPFWGEGLTPQRLALLGPIIISFVVFTTSLFAETNRMPFDLPECETELVGGYHTEYSSMKFALFFMGEYAAMAIGSALIVTMFFGGWSIGFGLDQFLAGTWYGGLIHFGVFLAKVIAFILFFIAVRWTVPRFRYDQLMKLGWIWFFEIALANIFLTAAVLYFVK